jgi:predicted nucleotidyltransferase
VLPIDPDRYEDPHYTCSVESMKEMTMLDLARIDLADLCSALEDQSYETHWYLDRGNGEILPVFEFDEADESLEQRDLVDIEPLPSHEAYEDLADFAERVADPKAHDLLTRAIEGRGAFRRFKDTLFEWPDLRQTWFEFHDARMRRRALEWLLEENVVDSQQARDALDRVVEPEGPEISGHLDAVAIAQSVAHSLEGLYGSRLRKVLLFGSWARGDAHPESDIDVLVVLDRVDSWLEESKRMDDVLWRHSLQNAIVVSAMIVSEAEFAEGGEPMLIRAAAEGIDVA